MKRLIVLKIILLTFLFQSCENKTQKQKQAESEKHSELNQVPASKISGQSESQKDDAIVLGEDLAEIHAYAKRIYTINGVIYIDIDVVEIRYPTSGDYDESDREIINKNPKIRTYIIDKETAILSNICKDLTASELLNIQKNVLKDKNIIIIGRSKNGKMLEINFGCYG
ncbi:MAG: hypothetical protein ABIP95_12745 [Pelobium sp.]